MIPLLPLSVQTDEVTLPELELEVRRRLTVAAAGLARARWLEREAAALPTESTLPDTQRLLAEGRRLAERRVRVYTDTLQAVERASKDR